MENHPDNGFNYAKTLAFVVSKLQQKYPSLKALHSHFHSDPKEYHEIFLWDDDLERAMGGIYPRAYTGGNFARIAIFREPSVNQHVAYQEYFFGNEPETEPVPLYFTSRAEDLANLIGDAFPYKNVREKFRVYESGETTPPITVSIKGNIPTLVQKISGRDEIDDSIADILFSVCSYYVINDGKDSRKDAMSISHYRSQPVPESNEHIAKIIFGI